MKPQNIVILKKQYSQEYIVKLIDYESIIKKEEDYGTYFTDGFMDLDVMKIIGDDNLVKDSK